jgi:hypothetical protein
VQSLGQDDAEAVEECSLGSVGLSDAAQTNAMSAAVSR